MKWREEPMEIRSECSQARFEKVPRTRIKVWFVSIWSSILLWTCLVQLFAVGELWRPPFITGFSSRFLLVTQSPPLRIRSAISPPPESPPSPPPPSPPPPPRNYTSNGFLKVTCNGGLNQMRAAICDMVTVARLLNLTLVVPELDKTSFWADRSDFDDIFDVGHFIYSLRDEVRIIKRLPKRFSSKNGFQPLVMHPVSWSNKHYYLQQVLPLFSQYKVIHFNKTDARLANNGLPLDIQKLRCRVNTQALKFNSKIETLGKKLIHNLQEKGPFIALHLRYEMDMLAFSGCTHGCSQEEAEELKRMRYAFPWWREKEINSKERRSEGLCPLTPEEASIVLQALGFDNNTHIYIAAGEIYGSERRLKALRAAFPHIMKKEMLLDPDDLRHFRNHSSQMAALDFMVSVASDIFVPSYDGNMAKVVEGYRRHLGFKKTLLLDRKRIVELIDLHQNGTLSWDKFVDAVKEAHVNKTGQPVPRKIIPDKPKEEDYFYANPQECFCENTNCNTLLVPHNSSMSQQG